MSRFCQLYHFFELLVEQWLALKVEREVERMAFYLVDDELKGCKIHFSAWPRHGTVTCGTFWTMKVAIVHGFDGEEEGQDVFVTFFQKN